MLIVNLYCSTVRALAMPYNKVMLIKPNKASFSDEPEGIVICMYFINFC
jgi:hypothetical protein